MARLKQICLYFLIAIMFISSVPIGVFAEPNDNKGRSIIFDDEPSNDKRGEPVLLEGDSNSDYKKCLKNC